MLRLNFLFQDGMILPPDTGIPVWGSTAPEAQIEVSVAGKTAFTKADASGEFVAGLPGMSAGGPYELVVRDLTNERKIIIGNTIAKNVMVKWGSGHSATASI